MSRFKTPAPDLTLVGNTWRHFAFGEPLIGPLARYEITRGQFDAALAMYVPVSQALEQAGYTNDQAWAYLTDVAPWAVDLIGVSS